MDEDEKRKEYLLNIVLSISIGLLCSLLLLVLFSMSAEKEAYKGISPVTILIPLLIFSLLFVLSRKYSPTISSYILIAMLYGYNTWIASVFGVDLPSALLGYAMIVTMTSILISIRAGLVVAICVMAAIMGLGYAETHYMISNQTYWRDDDFKIDDGIEYSIIILIIFFLSWLSNGQIERSLRRAQASEKDLERQNRDLERIVEDRTRKITDLQTEKLTHLYQFVEFGKLSGGLFHDLAQPLTALCLQVEEIEKRTVSTPEALSVRTHLEHAMRLSKKIGLFVKTAKRSIRRSVEKEIFDVREEIAQSSSLFEAKMKINGISFSITEIPCAKNDGRNARLYGSAVTFHHIITNLISNAIDACLADKDERRQKAIRIVIADGREDTTIEIKDSGSGIAPEILPRIFDPFFTTKKDAGCGIGLSTAKFTLEKYFNGSIKAGSGSGAGTSFTLVFPKHRNLINDDSIRQEASK